ncbi:TniQ family protein [Streptomyces sp. NPDC001822]|uniref:TniQ family protein n=1 Tax=Streptomyces sp. NPDC001822 TaxID=3364614 RepID=UPI0036A77C7C
MSDIGPLPRSLIALPDESIIGYLLRLGHRLDQAPGQLLWRAGLTPAGHFKTSKAPAQHLFMLETAQLTRFARTTRLSEREADRLTLRSYVRSYPPVAEALVRPGHAARPRGVFPPWLFQASTRCCHLCLRGDGSVIQERHGGAWKRRWHLPVVFACLEHNLFLQDTCHGCRQPLQSGFPGAPRSLMPAPAARGLHPAQCRNAAEGRRHSPLCSTRLDASGRSGAELSPVSASLQRDLLELLEGDRAPGTALARFSDIRVMSAIISATWPHSASLLPAGMLKDAFEEHIDQRQRRVEDGQRRHVPWSAAPQSAVATAAMLKMADHYVRLSPDALREALAGLLARTTERKHPSWGPTWDLLRNCSPGFRRETEEALQRRFPPRLASPAELTDPLIEGRSHGYRAEQIPQELPEEWFKVFLEGSSPRPLPTSRSLRRVAALQLVQAATGVSRAEAQPHSGHSPITSPKILTRLTTTHDGGTSQSGI